MTIRDFQVGKVVILSSSFDTRAKQLNLFYVLVFFCFGTYVLFTWLRSDSSYLGTTIQIALVIAMYICTYRFANKAVQSERLFINSNVLEIVHQGLFTSKSKSYNISDITNFRHLQKSEISDHPLTGKSFDYLGFNTSQKVITEMYGDNRLAFDYKNQTIFFGENIYSWDFDQLETLLNQNPTYSK